MQAENPAGRILYVTGNPNSNRLIIFKSKRCYRRERRNEFEFLLFRKKEKEDCRKKTTIFEKR